MQEIYNVRTKNNEDFIIKDNKLKIYLCGPTVYDSVHIGNIRPLIFFDTIARYFSYLKVDVDYISNITDIDDKIIKKSNDENKSYKEISKRYAMEYLSLFKEFNIEYPKKSLYATDYISDMLKLISDLVKNNKAYVVDGDVFFKVHNFLDYGKISGQSISYLKESGRIEKNNKKLDNLDFILWKKTDTPNFKSQFSDGRPGWHSECAAINLSYFKDTIDIHGGGMDLKFPHHENENAQFKAETGKDLARYFLYVGHIDFESSKMSKSKGNIILAKDVKNYANPMSYKLLVLAHNYHQRINFSLDLLMQYEKEYTKISSTINKKNFQYLLNNIKNEKINNDIFSVFIKYMENDFATQNIISYLFELVKTINKENNLRLCKEYTNTLVLILEILGIKIDKINYTDADLKLYEKWLLLKNNKDFKNADIIRLDLIKKGIIS